MLIYSISSLSLSELKSEVNTLSDQFHKLQLSLDQTEAKVKAIFDMFMEVRKMMSYNFCDVWILNCSCISLFSSFMFGCDAS